MLPLIGLGLKILETWFIVLKIASQRVILFVSKTVKQTANPNCLSDLLIIKTIKRFYTAVALYKGIWVPLVINTFIHGVYLKGL